MPCLDTENAASGGHTLLTVVAQEIRQVKYVNVAVGGLTEVAGLAMYGQGRRQEKKQGVLEVAAALYRQNLAEAYDRGTPAWARIELDSATPHFIDRANVSIEPGHEQLPIA